MFDGCGERERSNGSALAVIGDHVTPALGSVTEHEHAPPTFRTEVKQLVAGAFEEAGKVEIAGLVGVEMPARRGAAARRFFVRMSS